MVKHLPALQETWVQFLGLEDPLEKEMAIHSSTLAWKIPWAEPPDRLQATGSQRVGHDWVTSLHFCCNRLCCFSVAKLCLTVTPCTAAHQAPLNLGIPGKDSGVGCHALLQGIFPTQGLNPGLLQCRQILYRLSHQGSPLNTGKGKPYSLSCMLFLPPSFHSTFPLTHSHTHTNRNIYVYQRTLIYLAVLPFFFLSVFVWEQNQKVDFRSYSHNYQGKLDIASFTNKVI